jgi:hypothetical protein
VLVTLAFRRLTGLMSAVATRKTFCYSRRMKSRMPLDCPSMEYSRWSFGGLTIIYEAFLSNCKNCLTSSEFIRSLRTMILRRNSSRPARRASMSLSVILKR